MEKQDFDNLVQGLKEAAAKRRGELASAGTTMIKPVDVKRTRELTGQSQADFARMMWISPRTLQIGSKGGTTSRAGSGAFTGNRSFASSVGQGAKRS